MRKICLKRGFDCHDIKEAIYYYSIKNHLDYPAAQRIIAKAPKDIVKGSIDLGKDVLYTSTITEEINRQKSPKELLQFFEAHRDQFRYNNATAIKYICSLWDEIAGTKGLVYQESGKVSNSTWNTYLQILGLDDDQVNSLPKDRSLKSILKDNAALHHSAEGSFPDRQGIEAVLNGKHISNERVRKILILFLFYRFWAKLSIKNKDTYYHAKAADAERCVSEINKYLLDAGYPGL